LDAAIAPRTILAIFFVAKAGNQRVGQFEGYGLIDGVLNEGLLLVGVLLGGI
jgi:hypothetical protein